MAEIEDITTQLADLMDEFKLEKARLSGDDWRVSFNRKRTEKTARVASAVTSVGPAEEVEEVDDAVESAPVSKGTPINSPMTGIYYSSPSPTSPAFVSEGATVQAGDVVGLIEAMKVFNEIHSPISGTVTKMCAESGQLVNPGDPLLYIS
ncbi:MAG: acetyl-CoA carboxylase biotin carboxyl carrier protein subunit [Fimbriimonadaceae bacterium]